LIVAGVLRGRLRLARAALRAPPGDPRGRAAWVDLVLAALLAAVVLQATRVVFGRLAAHGASAAEAGPALGMLLVTAFAALGLFEVHLALTTLVLDSDLELLRAAPIGPGQLLLIKLADSLPATGALFVAFAGPGVLSFGLAFGLPWWAWAAAPAALAGLWAIPLGIGMALSLLLLRVVPARVVREALGLAATLTVTVVLLANTFLLPRAAEDARALALSLAALGGRLAALEPLLPPLWVARALTDAASGAGAGGVAGRLALVAASGALSLGALVLAARSVLEPVMSRLAAAPARRRGGDASARIARGPGPRGALAAMVRRDLRLFVRDWPLLADVGLAVMLWPLAALLLPKLDAATGEIVLRTLLLMVAVGAGMEFGTRSVPIERTARVWNQLAGVAGIRWVGAKAIVSGLLATPLVAAAATVLALALAAPPRECLAGVAFTVPALALSIAIGIGIGIGFGQPDWMHHRAMIRLGGRLLAMVLVIAQAAAWVVGVAVVRQLLDSSAVGATGILTFLAASAAGGGLALLVLARCAAAIEREFLHGRTRLDTAEPYPEND
jgi:hypothetical protein